ncbi:hypothetical protein TIFTF001_033810 [Ficus carica]|uniref:Uncharacterized protein n=1 Tax=Ficus carica TaxID=3494 RepID=A0AA88DZZ9_FICCA|nr:hypothetical protein TIFTF001_033810 [Ficus carica]
MNSSESSSNESMDSRGWLQNHLRAAPFKLCAKSLHIMSSSMSVGMFVDCGTGPYGAGGNSGVDRCVGVEFLLGSGSRTGCAYVRRSAVTGVFPGVDRGCIRAMGLFVVVRIPWG